MPVAIADRVGRPACMTRSTEQLIHLFLQHALQTGLHLLTNERFQRLPCRAWGGHREVDLQYGRWRLFDAGILPGVMHSPEKVPPSAGQFHTF
jgi:hypothetical protein